MTWIPTFSGVDFNYADVGSNQIRIEDIAHALSNICRFGGHTKHFYSVAEHSIYVSRYCPPEMKLIGLLHDATEAYVWDMIKPLKSMDIMKGYRKLENDIWQAISNRYDLPHLIPNEVEVVDQRLLETERLQVYPHVPHRWSTETGKKPYKELRIHFYCPKQAEEIFLVLFKQITADLHWHNIEE